MVKPNVRRRLRYGASTVAMGIVSLLAPIAAQAQDAPAQPAEQTTQAEGEEGEIVVSGIRAALETAQSIKQNSEQFVDSITAVDIGRLPDVNIAEAVQRISGVQITRNYGEGSGIAVRGLTQVRSELNGRDIFSANGGRGLSWEEVGSDLLAGVDVYKNPSAELIEGGLSGTINLRTRLPFDAKGRIISASAAVTRYDLVDKTGFTLSGLVSDRWQTGIGEIGLMGNVSYQETSFRQDEVVVEPYRLRTDIPGFVGQNVFAPQGGGVKSGFGDRERMSVALAGQWKPADNLEIYAQFLRADYKYADQGTSFFIYDDPMPVTPGSTWTVEGGIATSGSFRNGRVDSVTFAADRDTSTSDYAFGAKWALSERLRFSTDFQFLRSNARQQVMNLTISAFNPRTGPGPDYGSDWDFVFDNRGDIPQFRTNPAGYLSNINNYGFTAVLPYAEDNDAEGFAWRGDLDWDFDGDFLKNVKAGVRYTDKDAINRSTTYNTWTAVGAACANWGGAGGCQRASSFPDQVELNPITPDFLRGNGSNIIGPHYQWKLSQVRNPASVFAFLARPPINQTLGFRPFDDPGAVVSDISEKTYAGYLRAGFRFPIGGMEMDGNVGVRVVRTESSATGVQTITYRNPNFVQPDPANPVAPPNITLRTDAAGSNEYTNVLPSLNLRLKITPQLQLRFAASKNAARPNFTQLNSTFGISPTYSGNSDLPDRVDNTQPVSATNPYIGTGTSNGSPSLKPERVTQFDAALEYYFDRVGFVYVTGFYKEIKDLLFNVNGFETYNLAGVGDVRFSITRLSNVNQGKVKGFEVGGQKFFDFLPAPFDGLGVQANYTYVDSNAGIIVASEITGGVAIPVPLVNLSKHSYNLVGLFEKDGLNLRVAYNWRDDYLEGTQNTGTGNLPIFGKAYGVLDASVSYDFTPNIALTLDAQNLLNSEFRTYQINHARLRDYQVDDRRFTARLRIRL
jgi:iron complex outermembrane receptor protein